MPFNKYKFILDMNNLEKLLKERLLTKLNKNQSIRSLFHQSIYYILSISLIMFNCTSKVKYNMINKKTIVTNFNLQKRTYNSLEYTDHKSERNLNLLSSKDLKKYKKSSMISKLYNNFNEMQIFALILFLSSLSKQVNSQNACFQDREELLEALKNYSTVIPNIPSPVPCPTPSPVPCPTPSPVTLSFNITVSKYGCIEGWCTGNVKDMSRLIFDIGGKRSLFNEKIGNWNVSNVKTMKEMFEEAFAFNQLLRYWDVSNVEDMEGMFSLAFSFDQYINDWNVSKVKNMRQMFFIARVFNQPLYKWIVSNVTNMQSMFYAAFAFNQSLRDWDVSNVDDMRTMFIGYTGPLGNTSFNQDLCLWGLRIKNGTRLEDIFSLSSCTNKSDPILSANPPGPFCENCPLINFPTMDPTEDLIIIPTPNPTINLTPNPTINLTPNPTFNPTAIQSSKKDDDSSLAIILPIVLGVVGGCIVILILIKLIKNYVTKQYLDVEETEYNLSTEAYLNDKQL
ncbi:MAG: BspA family leucine-rich repeat surface protein [Bacteroidetes bacterium]|nr:BspA family leucine-rich repeat surface protein [Bacteroidota bacterium]